jgi:hypothetical protein
MRIDDLLAELKLGGRAEDRNTVEHGDLCEADAAR